MNTIIEDIRIDAPKAKVWDIIADLTGVQNFSPSVRKAYYITDLHEGMDAGRVCEFDNNLAVEERVIDWQEGESYKLSVDFIRGMTPPLKNVVGQLKLRGNEDHTVVTMTMQYETKMGPLGMAMNHLMIKNQYQKTITGILQGLKYHAETGEVVDAEIPDTVKVVA